MLHRMLEHQKGQNLSHSHEMIRGSQSDLPLEINHIKIQKHSSVDPGKEISHIPTEEI
jgi:hypothetical protein